MKKNSNKWNLAKVEAEAKKYKTRSEFSTKRGSAYDWARVNGVLDEVCAHMQRPAAAKKWNLEKIKEEAKKYPTRNEFRKQSGGAYEWARTNGLLDAVCTHMKRPKKWDLAKIKAEAKKYNSRNEFRKKAGGAYQWAIANGLLDEICTHMQRPPSATKKWNLNKIKGEAKKYNYRNEFKKNAGGAYYSARTNGILDEVCAHMKYTVREKWNLAKVKAEAKKCKTRSEFAKKANVAYNWARKNGVLDEVCSHMPHPPLPKKWDLVSVKAEAKKYKSLSEFAKNNQSAYRWAKRNCVIDEVCPHMPRPPLPKNWNLAEVKAEAKKYNSRSEFHKNNQTAYNWARTNGILDEACAHMHRQHSAKKKWNLAKIKAEAKKYKTRYEFAKKVSGAYEWARTNGVLDEVCTHMKPGLEKWNLAKVKDEAKKYKTRYEFGRKAVGAYHWARTNGVLDEVCAHMKPRRKKK